MKVGASHRFSRPRRQYGQDPSTPPSQDTPTRAPIGKLSGRSVDDLADDLMAGDQRAAERGEFAFDDVQVGPADPARADAQQHVPRLDPRLGNILMTSGLFRLFENSSSHKTAKGSLSGFLNFAVLNAVRAHFNALRSARDHRVHLLQVDVPTTLRHVVRVADPVSELGAAPAKITHFRHCLQSLLVLFTLCQSTISGDRWENGGAAH